MDDGSGADEAVRLGEIVEGFRRSYPFVLPLLALPVNQGKGGAVYAGWAQASAEVDRLAFTDADGSCSAAEVARVISSHTLAGEGAEPTAFFASRIKMLGRRVDRLVQRHLLGRVFATLVSELLGIPVYDSQCGLKVVPRKAYEKVAKRLTIHRFAFDVELLVALLDTGCQVNEVPIDWHEVPGSRVRLLRDSWLMARDVLKIRERRAVWRDNSEACSIT